MRKPGEPPRGAVPRSSWYAGDFWDERNAWVNNTIYNLQTARETTSLSDLLDQLQTNIFLLGATGMEGITAKALRVLRARRQGDEDINGDLVTLKLRPDEFDFLSSVIEREPAGNIRPEEWPQVYSMIVQRVKQHVLFPAWREEELQAGILLAPTHFRLRLAAPESGAGSWYPKQWRSTWDDRWRWEARLRDRIEQDQALVKGVQAAVRAAEDALLVELRNELLQQLPGPGFLRDKIDAFRQRFLIDPEAGPCQRTSRVAQAIESLQGLLFGARNGLLEEQRFAFDAPHFDEEWRWIGSYTAWRAAILIYLYPEKDLRPTLRPRRTRAFDQLVDALRRHAPLTPERVATEIAAYEDYFADVCSLSPAALSRTDGLLPAGALGATSGLIQSWTGRGDVLTLARGGRTGRFYASVWRLRPGWGLSGSPDQTQWDEIPGFREATDILGIVPYERAPGDVHAAVYARTSGGDTPSFAVSSFDGASFTRASAVPALPPLLRAAEYGDGQIPADPATPGSGAHRLQPNDRVVAIDLDGDGRQEVVVFAAALEGGQRRVALLRERGGGLVLSWTGLLAAAWQTPHPDRPVTVRLNTTSRLIVVDRAGNRIGMLGSDGASGLQIFGATGTVTGSSGSWTVVLGPENAPTASLHGDLMGPPSGEVLVFAYLATGEQFAPTRTVMHRLGAGLNGFTFSGTFGLDHHESADPQYPRTEFGVRWDRFVPTHNGTLILATRDEWRQRHNSVNYTIEPVERMRVLRWASSGNALQPIGDMIFESKVFDEEVPVPGLTPADDPAVTADVPAWSLAADDRWISPEPVKPGAATSSKWVAVFNPSRLAIAVLVFTPQGLLRVAWQRQGRLDPERSEGEDWDLHASDNVIAADLDGDGHSELVITRSDEGRMAVIRVRADRSLVVSWVGHGRVSAANLVRDQGWTIRTSAARLLVADLDADSNAELVALATAIDGTLRLGVLRGIPSPIPPFVGSVVAAPTRYGPANVPESERTIRPKLPHESFARRRAAIEGAYVAITGSPSGAGFLDMLDRPDLLYLDEAFYFVPMEIGLRLRAAGHHTAALDWVRSVYDYERPPAERVIAFWLTIDALRGAALRRAADWLRDPLNPHAIAATRRYSYTRYTILSIVRALLTYADAEFTRATAESVPRARELYAEALELLGTLDGLGRTTAACDQLFNEVEIGDPEWIGVWAVVKSELETISAWSTLERTLDLVSERIRANGDGARSTHLAGVLDVIARAREEEAAAPMEESLDRHEMSLRRDAVRLLDLPDLANALDHLGDQMFRRELVWQHVPAPKAFFCVPPNDTIDAARRHAELSLQKIRSCRAITGLELPSLPWHSHDRARPGTNGRTGRSPALRPLPYRYAPIVERAKELTHLAGQLEERMLAAIQSHDRAAFEELTARQALDSTAAGVRMKELQQIEAAYEVEGTQLGLDKSRAQRDHFEVLLRDGLSTNESKTVAALARAASHQRNVTIMTQYAAIGSMVDSFISVIASQGASSSGMISSSLGGMTNMEAAQAAAHSSRAQYLATVASLERRELAWRQEQALAEHDVRAGEQQIRQARERVGIAAQDVAIAALQETHAREIFDFLTAKRFANADLFDWISEVLEDVYRYFLHQATSMARMAEAQLAFERQELFPASIQTDYWIPQPAANGPYGADVVAAASAAAEAASGVVAERRGLTGSARLLRDIYALDDLAFRTNALQAAGEARPSRWRSSTRLLSSSYGRPVCCASPRR